MTPSISPLSGQQVDLLMQPLHSGRVKTRSQGGATLSYLEAFDIRATLIRVFGFGGFDIQTLDTQIVRIEEREPSTKGGRILYAVTTMARAQITIHATGAIYSDVAACTQVGPVLGDALDFSIKTSASDAMKRCAVNLGSMYGLGLYDGGSLAEVVRVVVAPGQERSRAPARPPEKVADMIERATTPDGEVKP